MSETFYYKEDIVGYKNFISKEEAESIIKFFELPGQPWEPIAFYKSEGAAFQNDDPRLVQFGLPSTYFAEIRKKFQDAVEKTFGIEVKANSSHGQKWLVDAFAVPHSDNSEMDGTPNAFQINKFVAILYLNDDYTGGELYFPDHNIDIFPDCCELVVFPGGHENIHGVRVMKSGTRYTMVSFWDYADANYDDETTEKWKEEIKEVREFQKKQREDWENGIIS